MKEQPQTKLTSFHWLLIGAFLFYLAFASQEVGGNNIFMGVIALGCMIIGLLKNKRIHRSIMKKSGIVEIDLEDERKDQNNTNDHS